METIEKELKHKIHYKILDIINSMMSKNIDIKNIKNYFKHKNNFNNLLKDIKWIGVEMINNDKSTNDVMCIFKKEVKNGA